MLVKKNSELGPSVRESGPSWWTEVWGAEGMLPKSGNDVFDCHLFGCTLKDTF